MSEAHLAAAPRISGFWMNVAMSNDEACWPWTGYREDGYGRFFWEGRMVGAHELALTFATGEIRAVDLDTCHRCNNPICCNPRHLRFDTRASNVADMVAADRSRNGNTRLTASDVVVMRQRYQHGAAQSTLARDYGVSPTLVSAIIRGRRWSRADGPITERKYNRNGQ